MIIKIKNITGLKLPTRANLDDAGYDVVATSGPKISGDIVGMDIYKSINYIEYGTNLFIAPHKELVYLRETTLHNNYFVELRPRSSISKYNLILANSPATIDISYRGEIIVRFKYIFQPEDFVIGQGLDGDFYIMGASVNMNKIYKVGDKICQLRPVLQHDIEWVSVDSLDETSRGASGFGSSGS